MTSPVETVSPTLIVSFSITPFSGDGISRDALSVSIVTRPPSCSTVSPAPTRTSMTSTFSKSPRSGTTMSIVFATYVLRLQCHRIGTIRIDTVFSDRLRDRLPIEYVVFNQSIQCRNCNETSIDFEMLAECFARIAPSIAIGAQRIEVAGYPPLNLVCNNLHIVRRRNIRACPIAETLFYISLSLRFIRMQMIPALDFKRITTQFVETRNRPDISRNPEIIHQEFGSSEHLAQDRARTHQLHTDLALAANLQQVHTSQDAVFHARRHRRLHVVFVHAGDVIKHVLLLTDHAAQTVLNDHRQFVSVGWIVRMAVRNCRCGNQTMAILVLQALARQGSAPRRAANQEATRLHVATGPYKVADTLETKHGVVDVERHHRDVVIGVRRASSYPRTQRTAFINAFLENLAALVLAVVHQFTCILRLVKLPLGRVNADLTEHAFHAKSAGLVRHDRYDMLANLLVPGQGCKHPNKRHCRRR